MSAPVIDVTVEARDGAARATVLVTPRGRIHTPCFMPVGTRGAVRTLDAEDVVALGAEVILANTYHLMLRPGVEVVESLGGLHDMLSWDGHVLTDSGGYQVFSLSPKVDDDGVSFRSTYDGTTVHVTPEQVVAIQRALGADIQMVLDVCPALPAPSAVVRDAVDRTARWASRARDAHRSIEQGARPQALFGIVQGGTDEALRRESAARTVELGFDGYGIGGLSVGEPRSAMLPSLASALEVLPADRPRYLMGVGDPRGIVEAIALGVDLFDCVLPTRLARHGTILTGAGRLNLRNARFRQDRGPLDPACGCRVCARYSRGYLRHLLAVDEPTGHRLCTVHNVGWLLALVARARHAIATGSLSDLRSEIAAAWP